MIPIIKLIIRITNVMNALLFIKLSDVSILVLNSKILIGSHSYLHIHYKYF